MSQKTVGPSRHPKFAHPPITEIGISVLFNQHPLLTTAHLGRFWERVAEEFPTAEDHAPSGLPLEWGKSSEGLPLPRLWLVQPGGAVLLQLQVNRFDLNWRWMPAGDAYPSFDLQLKRFLDYWERFAAFVGERTNDALSLRGAEVYKISHIKERDGWTDWSDVEQLFPALALTQVSERWTFQAFATAFEMQHEAGRVRAELKLGLLTAEPTRKVLTLELRSEASNLSSTTQDTGNLPERLAVANEMANLAFTSLISEDVQKRAWGRTE